MTGHFTAFVMWPINATYFNKLPADVQKVLLEEGKKAGDEMTQLHGLSPLKGGLGMRAESRAA